MTKELAVRILNGEELATPEQMLKATSMAVNAFCGAVPMVRCINCQWWEPAWHRCSQFNCSTRNDIYVVTLVAQYLHRVFLALYDMLGDVVYV